MNKIIGYQIFIKSKVGPDGRALNPRFGEGLLQIDKDGESLSPFEILVYDYRGTHEARACAKAAFKAYKRAHPDYDNRYLYAIVAYLHEDGDCY